MIALGELCRLSRRAVMGLKSIEEFDGCPSWDLRTIKRFFDRWREIKIEKKLGADIERF
jgi:hypothetical protein